jgi:predicted AAA+ superfamily ATPase
MENLVISYSETKNYWRESGKEIDLILLKEQRIIPVEVKNKEEIRKEDWNNILYFLKKYKLGKGYFIYNGEKKIIFIDKKEISLIPFWDWLLEE